MKNLIPKIRKILKDNHIDAIIIDNGDPHLSEYPHNYWKVRNWATGFTGSNGYAIISQNKAALWTDSRYFIQAEQELDLSIFEIQKIGMPDSTDILNWIRTNLNDKARISLNFQTISYLFFLNLKQLRNIEIVDENYKIEALWTNRPQIEFQPIYHFQNSGTDVVTKLQDIKIYLSYIEKDAIVVSQLDNIAWLLNLRGSDIPYSPLFFSYFILTQERGYLFINKPSLPKEIARALNKNGIEIINYQDFIHFYKEKFTNKNVLIDGDQSTALWLSLNNTNEKPSESRIAKLKNIKTPSEINLLKNAMKKDCIALIRLNLWIEEQKAKHTLFTEYDICKKLREIKTELPDFKDESFATIAGFGPNGAIVHYSPQEQNSAIIGDNNFLLLDCGTQYLDGTTDITRTIPIGEVSAEQKRAFTAVLKGHIALANKIFNHDTQSCTLDKIAKTYLWQQNLDYQHGTGHGIGFFLSVHEPPLCIRSNNFSTFKEGMVLSNEPGVYIKGAFGIRIENVICVKKHKNSDFLELETLSLFPIDTNAIDFSFIEKTEIDWLNNYHARIFSEMKELLNEKELNWLKNKTQPITK